MKPAILWGVGGLIIGALAVIGERSLGTGDMAAQPIIIGPIYMAKARLRDYWQAGEKICMDLQLGHARISHDGRGAQEEIIVRCGYKTALPEDDWY